MAKAGAEVKSQDKNQERGKEFSGSGVEGQKDGESERPFSIEGANSCITIRNGRAVRVWFRNGKEIGEEDAG